MKIKYIFLFVFALITTLLAKAQVNTYLKTGVSASITIVNLREQSLPDTTLRFYTPLIRPTIGFGIEYDFWDKKLKIITGMDWVTRGYREPNATYDTIPGFPKGLIAHMISFPINIGYQINDRFSILVGARIDKNIWKNKNYSVIYPDYTGASVFNSITGGFNLGAEYKFKNTSFGFEYYHDLTSVRKENLAFTKLANKAFYRSFQIYARFNFVTSN